MGWFYPHGRGKRNRVTTFLNMMFCYIIFILGETKSVVLLKKLVYFCFITWNTFILQRGKERKGSLLIFLLSPSFFSRPLSLAVSVENSALDSGVCPESKPVVSVLIDLFLFPLHWLFPSPLNPSFFILFFILVPFFPPGQQSEKGDSISFLSHEITLAGFVAGSVFVHLSCIAEVVLFVPECYPEESNQECCEAGDLTFPNCGLNSVPKKCCLVDLLIHKN